MNEIGFLRRIEERPITLLERALALLWWAGRSDPSLGRTSKEICVSLEAAGHSQQNSSRLERQLAADRRTSKDGHGGWRLRPGARRDLDDEYGFALLPAPPPLSDSVLPRSLFVATRGYIERLVEQVNRGYDSELFDCSAVLCRRLVETLIIEVYEAKGRANEIKDDQGHFLRLGGLVSIVEKDASLDLGRNTKKTLRDLKALGDLSAHNRRFSAQRADIDRLRDGIRAGTEELLHLASLR